MKLKFLPVALLVFINVLGTDSSKPPFSLAVVPSKSFGEGGHISMAQNTRDDFYVVLTNTSKEPQAVWEYWNSWGYQTIAFEFTTSDGRKVTVSKRTQEFTRNFPSTFLIPPGQPQVYRIRLDKEWFAHPALPKDDEMRITMKAVYEVSPSPESTQYKVWAGRLESPSYNFTLKQW